MNRYVSLIFLYNRASGKRLLLITGAVPLCFLAVFFLRIGNPHEAEPYMLMERAFGGIGTVLLFLAASAAGLAAVASGLNGRKAMKATHTTTGYTMRRLRLSPVKSYLTVFVYAVIILWILWAVAAASLYAVGKMGLAMAGASGIDTRLALGLLRTDIGHVLLPVANPGLMLFNVISVLALAGECAKSCYLSWHNGRPSAGVILVIAAMLLVWGNLLENIYILLAMLILICYTALSAGDVISRERHPKGDPFRANQYAGIMDMNDFDYDDSCYAPQANVLVDDDPALSETAILERYGRVMPESGKRKAPGRLNPAWLRRRWMPLGINLERANACFGAGIAMGIGQHLLFLFRYILRLREIQGGIKGVSVVSGMKMPYFWDLEAYTYVGYIAGILMVFVLQACWNYQYYNKKTKSVYVMKRLPDRKEYRRTIWAAPAVQALSVALIGAAHTAIDLVIYVLGTPDIALYPDYLSKLLPL